eukprot:3086613-Rhodomonas_salina.1
MMMMMMMGSGRNCLETAVACSLARLQLVLTCQRGPDEAERMPARRKRRARRRRNCSASSRWAS